METISSLVACKGFREYIATIVHTMINVIEVYLNHYSQKDSDVLVSAVFGLLKHMGKHLKLDFAPFIPLIQRSMEKTKRPMNDFAEQVE